MSDMTLFDLSDFDPKPVYTGRADLLDFTREYFSFEEWESARPFMTYDKRNWRHSVAPTRDRTPAGCELIEYSTDLRCKVREHGDRLFWRQASPMHFWQKYPDCDQDPRCECVGTPVTMVACDRCQWHHIDEGNSALFAWLDHAWSGWRDLPLIPAEIQPPYGGALQPKNGSPNSEDVKAGKKSYEWAVANYPTEWQIPGAPARAEKRDGPWRGVIPAYAPFGGLLAREVAA